MTDHSTISMADAKHANPHFFDPSDSGKHTPRSSSSDAESNISSSTGRYEDLHPALRYPLRFARAILPEKLFNWRCVLIFLVTMAALILSIAFVGEKDVYIYPFKLQTRRTERVPIGQMGELILRGNLGKYSDLSVPMKLYREVTLLSGANNAVRQDYLDDIFVDIEVTDEIDDKTRPRKVLFTSLLPQIICICFAAAFHSVFWALGLGLAVGLGLGFHGNLWEGFAYAIWPVFMDLSSVYLLLFNFQLVGAVFVMQKTGGLNGLMKVLTRFTDTPYKVRLISILANALIFFDDYGNAVVVGSTFRPLTDFYYISREKFSYIVDSTSAPIAGIAIISTWIGVELLQIEKGIVGITTGDEGSLAATNPVTMNSYQIFLHCLPYRFYCIGTLIMMIVNAVSNKDFGPMLWAERRSYLRHEVYAPGANVPVVEENVCDPDPGTKCRWYNSAIPVIVLIIAAIIGLYADGLPAIREKGIPASVLSSDAWQTAFGSANPGKVLFFASFGCTALAVFMPIYQGIAEITPLIRAYLRTIPTMFGATCIIIMAWSLKNSSDVLGTKQFLSSIATHMKAELFPLIMFLLAALIAFSIGSSWGTMTLLIPVCIPLYFTIVKEHIIPDSSDDIALPGNYKRLFFLAVASIMDGAVCGDHCSPISDTTVLSSTSTQCDLLDHVKTQLPYAIISAAVTIVAGHICVGYGMPVYIFYLICLVLYVLIFLVFGTDLGQYQDPDTWTPAIWDINAKIFGTDAKWIKENSLSKEELLQRDIAIGRSSHF